MCRISISKKSGIQSGIKQALNSEEIVRAALRRDFLAEPEDDNPFFYVPSIADRVDTISAEINNVLEEYQFTATERALNLRDFRELFSLAQVISEAVPTIEIIISALNSSDEDALQYRATELLREEYYNTGKF
ncbi:MAG: hypothetical protein IJL33_00250 [Ruminococcus sp.]|nr:hypothetical protein [Ruminococcus sp.]